MSASVVPHDAAIAQSNAQPLETASLDSPSATRESLSTLVAVANDLCATWNLNMEFALEHDGDDDDSDDATVLVKKVLDRERYSLVKWKRPMLEAKVAFLRQMAASLEASGTLVVAEHKSEAESMYGSGTEREQDDRATGDSMSTHAKISSHRDADMAGDATDDATLIRPPTPPPTRISSSQIDASLGPAHTGATSTSGASTSSALATPPVVRLIGHGRIYMPPLKSYSSGPMIAAVFDTTGQSIGKLFVHLQYMTTTSGEQAAERRPSFMDLMRRPSLLTLPHAAKTPANVHTTMRVHLGKVVFDEPQVMARDGVSLTLKRSSQAKAPRSAPSGSRDKASNTADNGAAASGPTANFSTPKTPPVACDASVPTAKAPLTLFQVGKVFETRLSFGDTAGQRKAGGSTAPDRLNSASSNGGGSDATQDDFVAFEAWGYGQALAPIVTTALGVPTPASTELGETAEPPAASRHLEFYVSVDIDERESDGIFRPVAVKADGTLRIHANQPRRLNVRVTQADQQCFALASIASVRLARPFAASVDTASLSTTGGKSSQWLLSPSSIRAHSYEDDDSSAFASNVGADTSETAAAGGDGSIDPKVGSTHGMATWRTLAVRTESEKDAASRSVVASFKWDCDALFPEVPDAEGSRSVYRVVIALATTWSRVPIVLSKSIATKIAPVSVSTTLKLARELESTRMAWWARESFSRDYRLGTWYSADVTPTKASSVSASYTRGDSDSDATASSDAQVIVDAVVTRHIRGLQRLELVLELEHLRQQILKMTPFSATETVDARTASMDELSFDRVAESLSTLFENSDDDEQRFEIVALQRSTQLFVRKKTQRDVLIGVKYGNVVDLRPRDELTPTPSQSGDLDRSSDDVTPILSRTASWRDEVHSTHFVTEPSHLASGAVSEMAGFLMLATAFQVDEAAAAAAVVTPLPLLSPTSSARTRLEKPVKAAKASWERRWFVLKRPFLYAYKTFALKDEVGVLDISRCQLITMAPVSLSNSSDDPRTGRHHSSSSSRSSSSTSTRSGHALSSQVLAAIPFSFQLVSRAGTKCVVWTLQASTAPEMRAWLVAIDPLKIEAREAVVLNNQSNVETPVITA